MSTHWACSVARHPRHRAGEHSVKFQCPVAAGHNPSTGYRDCYTCKQEASKKHRGPTKQQADKLHFDCALMPWDHNPPNLMGSMGGHRDGCAVLPGHTATPGKQCPQCRRRYAGYEGLSPTETLDHPHYNCAIPILDHPIKPRVGRGHRPGCQVAEGHTEGGIHACRQCYRDNGGPAHHRALGLRKKYALTPEDYERMLEAQDGVCAICGTIGENKRPLHVDHDHATGAIRGLLCRQCNNGLGNFKDQIAVMESAIGYLKLRSAGSHAQLQTVGI